MNNREIPLEDTWVDVIGKAQRGLGISSEELATRSGLVPSKIASLLAGEPDATALPVLAEAMGLSGDRLLAMARGNYHPGSVPLPDGMAMLSSDWGGMQVHSYLLWDRESREAVAFDTGADAGEMLDFVAGQGLTLRLVLLTHGHGDHLFDLDRLVEKTGAQPWIGEGEGVPGIPSFPAGKEFLIGKLRIETRLTRGHAPGGITYVIHGLARPVAVVGDALFAGSMGGPMTSASGTVGTGVSYPDCLETNRKEILSLPPETILCPGHGPLTTAALEKANNPFFPEEI
jgi:glyoxylase-like metal-dependent hydrolase (beta-lactamase superfamily II)